eukprot:Nk52_evm1s1704 gene=Nk52_evmTU1s1704
MPKKGKRRTSLEERKAGVSVALSEMMSKDEREQGTQREGEGEDALGDNASTSGGTKRTSATAGCADEEAPRARKKSKSITVPPIPYEEELVLSRLTNKDNKAAEAMILNTLDSIGKAKTGSRYDTSLGILTKRFVSLLMKAPNGILDLNRAAEKLGVQKRRIYDITNVLEGIHLIVKKSKNHIQWRGSYIGEADAGNSKRARLKEEMKTLSEEEACLDRDASLVQASLRKLAEDPENVECAFVSHDDIRKAPSFLGDTIIAIKAPSGTKLEVPDPDEGMEYPHRRFQIFLRSAGDPIDVYLVSKVEDVGSQADFGVEKGGAESADVVDSYTLSVNEPQEEAKENPINTEKGDVFGPMNDNCEMGSLSNGVVKLASPPMDDDYIFCLDENEGISDFYDLGPLNSEMYPNNEKSDRESTVL